SGVRAPWVNLPVSPSGVPWARVSAFIAWIVSAIFACCPASLNHRPPWCSSFCIMVSILARFLDALLTHGERTQPVTSVSGIRAPLRQAATEGNVLARGLVEHDHEIIRRDSGRRNHAIVQGLQQAQSRPLGPAGDERDLQQDQVVRI